MKRAELDIVVLGEDLPDEGLEKGTVGTIVMVFDTPTLGYLVEFCDKEGRTIAMPALLPAQIKRYFTPGILKTLLVDNNYPVANPVNPEVMADVMRKAPPAEWDTQKKKVYEDIQRLMINRPDYSDMFQIMDGLEYNGLTLYSMANIYIRNVETHNNESAIDSNLSDKVLIGRNEMFVFVYSFTDDRFEIRDKTSPDHVIATYAHFNESLSAIIDSLSE